MDKYCSVYKCKFPYFHTKDGHQCGKCNIYGHGLAECNDLSKMVHLQSCIDVIPQDKQCVVEHCQHSSNHTNEGHKCRRCLNFGHSILNCNDMLMICPPLKDDIIDKESENIINRYMNNISGKIYLVIYCGMGCYYYAKRDDINKPITLFFMHSDMWGQYKGADDRPALKEFVNGYEPVDKNCALNL